MTYGIVRKTGQTVASRIAGHPVWCRLVSHRYGGFTWDADCERCGVERYDLASCPACDHENSVRVWAAGVTCENCGHVE